MSRFLWFLFIFRVLWFLSERDYVTFGFLLSQIRLSVVCLSVTFVHSTLPVEIFRNVSTILHVSITAKIRNPHISVLCVFCEVKFKFKWLQLS